MNKLQLLLNAPDLIFLAFLIGNIYFGCRRGFVRSLYALIRCILSSVAASFAAHMAAPIVAERIIVSIMGSVIQQRLQQREIAAIIDTLWNSTADKVTAIAESIAFIILLPLFCIIFSQVSRLIGAALHLTVKKIPPLRVLDSLAGGMIGMATGIAIASLIFLGIAQFSPISYSTIGYLSPQRIDQTVLVKQFISHLPLSI